LLPLPFLRRTPRWPHREKLISIETFLNGNQEASDKRILMQLADLRTALSPASQSSRITSKAKSAT